jgi:hypothetical protein
MRRLAAVELGFIEFGNLARLIEARWGLEETDAIAFGVAENRRLRTFAENLRGRGVEDDGAHSFVSWARGPHYYRLAGVRPT